MTTETSNTVVNDRLRYDNITEENKEGIRECLFILKELGLNDAAQNIAERVGFVDIPEYDIRESDFFNLCKENGISCNLQGHMLRDGVKYPVVGIYGEITNFDNLLLKYKQSVKKKFW